MKLGRKGNIPSFIVMDVMKNAASREEAGHRVFHMEVGQPSTGAPTKVKEAANICLDEDVLGYTVALGIDPLRRRISQYYEDYYGVEVPMERIAVTTGSSGAFLVTFLAAFNPGDTVAILRPGYPCYRNILSALDIETIDISVGPDTRYQPTIEMLDAAGGDKLDGVLIASPANPTGTMLKNKELHEIILYCRDRNIQYIADEIYHGITYDQKAITAAGLDDSVIVVNSFSKYFSMTGWRLGWVVLPAEMIRPVERLAQNLFISPPSLSQKAAIAAFECIDELDSNVARYALNRELLLKALEDSGLDGLIRPDGAFYIYVDVSGITKNSVQFCNRMLQEIGVATTPGNDFDPINGSSFVRFSFAGDHSDIAQASERLKGWLMEFKDR